MRALKFLRAVALMACCFCLCMAVGSLQEKPTASKRVVLNPVQAKMIQQIERDIEEVPEVKTLRAQERGIMAGIATSAGMTRWTWKADKGQIFIEEAPESKEDPKP